MTYVRGTSTWHILRGGSLTECGRRTPRRAEYAETVAEVFVCRSCRKICDRSVASSTAKD